MVITLIDADDKSEIWEVGNWIHERSLVTGNNRWAHYSEFDDVEFMYVEWSDLFDGETD